MNLTCNHCRHRWDDDVEDESTEVWCSRCGKSTPIQLALHPGESQPSPGGAPSDPGSDVTYVEAAGGESAGGEAVQLGSDPTVGGGEATELGEVTTGGHSDLGAPPAESAAMGSLAKSMEHLIGQNIDGFRFEKILGAGGMGAVFRAHQVSLDRDVAIKVLPSRFAAQPDLVARFTREALSAAQLTHHNIIQVYDVGSSEQIHYISMEYVRGDSLGGMVRRDGRIKIDDAAGYILQASRGLEYAHRRGIIHRDIKPDNLMVDEHGIVKIADMGLAKRIGIEEANGGPAGRARDEALKSMTDVNLTRADVAMGTPAYMAPEQGRDARAVDARADQYSLGCTLYYLCAGRAPYSGTTAFELMSKHMSEPLTPLTTHVKGVPPAFGRIIERMLEKDPEARYPSLVEAGQDLESYLGIDTAQGPYTPREMHVAILETALADYYAAASIPKRRMAKLGFFVLMGALFLGSIFARQFTLAGGILGLLVLTPVAGFTLDGIKNKRFLFRRVRSVFFGMPWKSWFMVGAGTLLGAGALWVLGWHWYWMGFAVVAAGLAAAYQWGVARPLEAERRKPIERIHQTLRELRIRGVAEGALQDFVSRFSGVHWEEFFEELFGYEAMIVARGKWAAADQVKPRKKHATWREPIARALEGIEEARKKAKEKKQLAKVETARLKAQGVSESEAQKKAAEEATRIVSEGFIQPPPEEKEKTEQKEKEKDEDDKWAKSGKRSLAALAAPLARAIFGAGLVAGYLIQQFDLSLPGPLADLLSRYYGWGLGGRVDALVAGVAVIASAFSKRFGLPWLVVVGAAMLVLRVPLIDLVDRPQFSEFTVFIGVSLLILLGIGPSIASKLSGGKF